MRHAAMAGAASRRAGRGFGDGDDDVGELYGNRLYRNPERGMVFGVCAGLADYFGFDVTIVRVLVVLGTLFFPGPLVAVGYVVMALLLPKDPRPARRRLADGDEGDLGRRIRAEPHGTLNSLRHRYREIEARLQRLEKYVTSERYNLDREFERLRD
ncbi:MAG: envelope stress response membrane protein PspC [Gammaproteobacteria bacterium]|nr:envelope stress response membrane protein PspC [Gammaproteobacteria bacterium]